MNVFQLYEVEERENLELSNPALNQGRSEYVTTVTGSEYELPQG